MCGRLGYSLAIALVFGLGTHCVADPVWWIPKSYGCIQVEYRAIKDLAEAVPCVMSSKSDKYGKLLILRCPPGQGIPDLAIYSDSEKTCKTRIQAAGLVY